jgi:uncharacterized membrane protein YphA (DoxX/SURF4 family)
MNIALWIIQVLLALLFLFSGSMKFVMSVEQMNSQSPVTLPGALLHFIGVCEILGGLGLILPMLLRIKPKLTPLAAMGLIVIMIGAIAITFIGGMAANAIVPVVCAILLAFVAYGRSRLAPIGPK